MSSSLGKPRSFPSYEAARIQSRSTRRRLTGQWNPVIQPEHDAPNGVRWNYALTSNGLFVGENDAGQFACGYIYSGTKGVESGPMFRNPQEAVDNCLQRMLNDGLFEQHKLAFKTVSRNYTVVVFNQLYRSVDQVFVRTRTPQDAETAVAGPDHEVIFVYEGRLTPVNDDVSSGRARDRGYQTSGGFTPRTQPTTVTPLPPIKEITRPTTPNYYTSEFLERERARRHAIQQAQQAEQKRGLARQHDEFPDIF